MYNLVNGEIKNKNLNISKILIAYLWVYESIVRYARQVLLYFPVIGSVLSKYLPEMLILVMILLLFPRIRRCSIKDVILVLVVLILSSITILIGSPVNGAFINEYFGKFILCCFPMYFLGLILSRELDDDLYKLLYWLSVAAILVSALDLMRAGVNIRASWSSSMYLPYIMLPHALLMIYSSFRKFSITSFAMSFISVLYILVMGNRGSVVCLAVFIIGMIIRQYLGTFNKKILYRTIALILLIVLAVIYYDPILDALYNFAYSHGFSVRLVLTLRNDSSLIGNLDSNRSTIYKAVWGYICSNPLGYWVSADVYLVGDYSHNIILETMLEYGVFGEIAIMLFFITRLRKAVKNNRMNDYYNPILWLLFCCSIVKLCISGTYFTDPYIFLFIGFCIGGARNYSANSNVVKELTRTNTTYKYFQEDVL